MFKKTAGQLGAVIFTGAVLAGLGWLGLRRGYLYGPWVLAMTLVPIAVAVVARLRISRLVPDLIFGAIDTGLLTIGAILGASGFGIVGAIVGGVVSDAITDGIAGFFEGGIAEWLRSKGIEESRTALGSACGKMAGCLAGSGLVLSLAALLGVRVVL